MCTHAHKKNLLTHTRSDFNVREVIKTSNKTKRSPREVVLFQKILLFYLFLILLLFQPQHRPALMLGAAEHSHPTMSVHTHPRPPCSWGPFLVAPCPACPQQVPPLNICVSRLTRFLMMCPCPRGGRWPRPPLARDTSSSKYGGNKCHNTVSCIIQSLEPGQFAT